MAHSDTCTQSARFIMSFRIYPIMAGFGVTEQSYEIHLLSYHCVLSFSQLMHESFLTGNGLPLPAGQSQG